MTSDQTERLITAFENIGYQIKCLGVGNAATEMGAIEFVAKEIKDGSERMSGALENIAMAIQDKE